MCKESNISQKEVLEVNAYFVTIFLIREGLDLSLFGKTARIDKCLLDSP